MRAFPLRAVSTCCKRGAFLGSLNAPLAHSVCMPLCSALLVRRHNSTGTTTGGKGEREAARGSSGSGGGSSYTEGTTAAHNTSAINSPASQEPNSADKTETSAPSPAREHAPASMTPGKSAETSSSASSLADTTATTTTPATPSDGVSSSTASPGTTAEKSDVTTPEPEPLRWVQPAYQDPDSLPIVDAKGEYIVSRVQWPTGEIAYRTPAPVDDKLAPRFGYNVVQLRKHVSWWKYNQRYPRLSLAYINIQVLFLLGLAWLVAFLTTEYRSVTEAMRTPGAMVGEHRGKGPATNQTQKVSFEKDEMTALMDKAQNNWYDGKAEANYVGSKEYKMKKIPRPKEFSADDFRKR